MKKNFFILVELLGITLLFFIPFLSMVYTIWYESIHWYHSTISSFILSGKLPLIGIFIVFLFEILIHFRFKPANKMKLKELGITPQIRRYRFGFWAHARTKTINNSLFRKNGFLLVLTIVSVILLAFFWFRYRFHGATYHSLSRIAPFFTMSGGIALATLILSILYTPYTSDKKSKRNVYILMPIYNEPIENLKNSFQSIMNQTVLPKEIIAVDDGSSLVNYDDLVKEYKEKFRKKGISFKFIRQKNNGKRAAQLNAYNHLQISDQYNDIILTIDSDTFFENHAIEQGIIPFEDARVYSVAGVIVTRNVTDNLLTIITDLLIIGHMVLIERSMNSMFGSVAVNSGPIAFYRAEVLSVARKLDYDNETFGKARVEFSDDSFLTLVALLLGRAVAQATAVSYTDLPNKFGHHIRQHLRWCRGSFIRGFWRLSLFPMNTFVFFRQACGWMMFVTIVIVKLQLIYWAFFVMKEVPVILLAPLAFSAVYSLSYLTIPRNDLATRDKWIVFLAFPFAAIWAVFVLSPIRVWGYLTHKNTGWGTREKIEL